MLQGEVSRLQVRVAEEQKELELLGAILINQSTGQVGLPTVVNGRPAFFSWQVGEDNVSYWHFDGEAVRRPIPASWNDGSGVRLVSSR
jgi:hypothetical protein